MTGLEPTPKDLNITAAINSLKHQPVIRSYRQENSNGYIENFTLNIFEIKMMLVQNEFEIKSLMTLALEGDQEVPVLEVMINGQETWYFQLKED